MFEYKEVSLSVALAPSPARTRDDLQARITQMQSTKLEERGLPVLPSLRALLPNGLRPGVSYSVTGSTALALAMLAGPSAQGAWCGALGMPELGTEAAAMLGIELSRLVLVPLPGAQWLTVAAAMTDVLSVVIARAPGQIGDAEASRLSARLRQRGSTLIVLGAWPHAEASLAVTHSSWSGLENGHGYLAGRELLVEVTGRGGPAGSRARRVRLPQAG